MADLAEGIAQYLTARGLLTYDPDGVTGDTFIDTMPPQPDQAVALTLYGSGEPDPLAEDDQVSLQVRIRGTEDPRLSRRRSQAIYSVLHGAAGLVLPDGTFLILAIAQQTTTSLGIDQNNRHEHVVNYRINYSNPTEHRS
jgi:hypothetical protein